jgi:hypothetical protein
MRRRDGVDEETRVDRSRDPGDRDRRGRPVGACGGSWWLPTLWSASNVAVVIFRASPGIASGLIPLGAPTFSPPKKFLTFSGTFGEERKSTNDCGQPNATAHGQRLLGLCQGRRDRSLVDLEHLCDRPVTKVAEVAQEDDESSLRW